MSNEPTMKLVTNLDRAAIEAKLREAGGLAEDVGAVFQLADALIARFAKQTPDLAGHVVVVDGKSLWLAVASSVILLFANCAFATLLHKHLAVFMKVNPKPALQITIAI